MCIRDRHNIDHNFDHLGVISKYIWRIWAQCWYEVSKMIYVWLTTRVSAGFVTIQSLLVRPRRTRAVVWPIRGAFRSRFWDTVSCLWLGTWASCAWRPWELKPRLLSSYWGCDKVFGWATGFVNRKYYKESIYILLWIYCNQLIAQKSLNKTEPKFHTYVDIDMAHLKSFLGVLSA